MMDCATPPAETETKSIIEDLLEKPFSQRKFSEKLLIILNGRPCPKLEGLKAKHKESSREYTRRFKETQYSLYPWLAGCENRMALFCWPCLLFSKTSSVWTTTGSTNLNTLQTVQKKHKQTKPHLECVLKLANFGEKNIDIALNSQSNNQHNLQVKKNREVLKRFIDVTCFLANQELPFRNRDDSCTSLNPGNYVEILNLLKDYDPVLAQHFETETTFKANSIEIQNDLIKAIGNVLSTSISYQLKEATFVAIMIDETYDCQTKSQLSVVFRYFLKGKINENFVGFIDASAGRFADDLFELIKVFLDKYDIKHKLVAQTYDGASVMSGHLTELQEKVKEICPNARFIHRYSHDLNLVLSQGLRSIRECRIFFSTINGIAKFVSNSGKSTLSLKEFLKTKIPSLATTRGSFDSLLVNVVHSHRLDVLEYFQNIYDDENTCEPNDRTAAIGYIHFMKEFETIFLLNLFSKLYFHSDDLCKKLKDANVDLVSCTKYIQNFEYILKTNREEGFKKFWYSIVENFPMDADKKAIRNKELMANEIKYKKLFYEIIDNLSLQVSERSSSLEKMKFINLLNSTKLFQCGPQTNFLEESIKLFVEFYPQIFELNQLKNELIVLYANSDDIKLPENNLKNAQTLTPYDVLIWLESKNIGLSFEQVYTLSELICTIPATTSSVEPKLSALKRIDTYLKRTQGGQERLSDLSLMSIEKELLAELRKSDNFYDRVIANFLKIEPRVDFIFR